LLPPNKNAAIIAGGSGAAGRAGCNDLLHVQFAYNQYDENSGARKNIEID
jgi:hypothetical protein